MAAVLSSPAPKPVLRGVSHQVAFFIALLATVLLVRSTQTSTGTASALVFGASLCLLFGVSAMYHRVDWSTIARQRMRRLDHAAGRRVDDRGHAARLRVEGVVRSHRQAPFPDATDRYSAA